MGMGMFDGEDGEILLHCMRKADEQERLNGVKKYKIIEACANAEMEAKDIGWFDEFTLKEKLNDVRAKFIKNEAYYGNNALAKSEAIQRMKDRNVGGVGDIYTAGEEIKESINNGDLTEATKNASILAFKKLTPLGKVTDTVEEITSIGSGLQVKGNCII